MIGIYQRTNQLRRCDIATTTKQRQPRQPQQWMNWPVLSTERRCKAAQYLSVSSRSRYLVTDPFHLAGHQQIHLQYCAVCTFLAGNQRAVISSSSSSSSSNLLTITAQEHLPRRPHSTLAHRSTVFGMIDPLAAVLVSISQSPSMLPICLNTTESPTGSQWASSARTSRATLSLGLFSASLAWN